MASSRPKGLLDWAESFALVLLPIGLLWFALGRERAMEEVITTALYVTAAAVVAGVFLVLRLANAAADIHVENLTNIASIEHQRDTKSIVKPERANGSVGAIAASAWTKLTELERAELRGLPLQRNYRLRAFSWPSRTRRHSLNIRSQVISRLMKSSCRGSSSKMRCRGWKSFSTRPIQLLSAGWLRGSHHHGRHDTVKRDYLPPWYSF